MSDSLDKIYLTVIMLVHVMITQCLPRVISLSEPEGAPENVIVVPLTRESLNVSWQVKNYSSPFHSEICVLCCEINLLK